MEQDLNSIALTLDELLGKSDISNTTAEGSNNELPDGYFLSEVVEGKLTSSKAGNPMVSIRYKVVEDGLKEVVDETGHTVLVPAKGTANKNFFLNYVFSNENQVNFFVSDMLKFADPEDLTQSLFAKEYFKSTQGILDVLEVLNQGCRIYVMVQSKAKKDNPTETEKKYNPISWARATKLELPM